MHIYYTHTIPTLNSSSVAFGGWCDVMDMTQWKTRTYDRSVTMLGIGFNDC